MINCFVIFFPQDLSSVAKFPKHMDDLKEILTRVSVLGIEVVGAVVGVVCVASVLPYVSVFKCM